MGHVQALKLLHPTKHRSSFEELRDWLREYHFQYEAKRIYKLGVKRKPTDAKNPKKNNYPSLDIIFTENLAQETKVSPLLASFTGKTSCAALPRKSDFSDDLSRQVNLINFRKSVDHITRKKIPSHGAYLEHVN